MTTPSHDCSSQGCVIEPRATFDGSVTRLNKYLLESSQELDAITEHVSRGEEVDHDSREWMLAQVDYIVDTIGNEDLELSDELRSDLLQLLLAIANLNEQIRSQASPSL
jgi:flagellar biosynthesis regulator FlaF